MSQGNIGNVQVAQGDLSGAGHLDINLPKGQLIHVLRDSFTRHFMANGGNILVLQRILDHATLDTTMVYAHFAPDHLQQAKNLNPLAIR